MFCVSGQEQLRHRKLRLGGRAGFVRDDAADLFDPVEHILDGAAAKDRDARRVAGEFVFGIRAELDCFCFVGVETRRKWNERDRWLLDPMSAFEDPGIEIPEFFHSKQDTVLSWHFFEVGALSTHLVCG